MTNAGHWVRTDEAEDVAASIRHVLSCRTLVGDDVQVWKWVALALHSALQGACVCHLVTTASPVGALTKESTREWLQFFETSRTDPEAKPPRTHLLALPGLLKAVRKKKSAGDRSNAEGVAISNAELNWLRRFHDDTRNQFVHFEPMGWSLEVSGIPALAQLVARIIGQILDIGWAFRHQDDQWRSTLQVNLDALSTAEWDLPLGQSVSNSIEPLVFWAHDDERNA